MSLLRLLAEHVGQERASGGWSDPIPAPAPDLPVASGATGLVLYVATTLEHWEGTDAGDEWHAWEDVEKDGRVYRRLDPYYFAWLGHKMELAEQAARDQVVDPRAYQRLLERFRAIDAWAREEIGVERLGQSRTDFDPRTYTPPRVTGHLFPADGRWRFQKPVASGAVALVDAIRERALSLGWSEARLYQNRGRHPFPIGGDYGLVSFLRWDEAPGEVTARWIEIVRAGSHRKPLRYYNPDTDHPWRARTDGPPDQPR